MARFGTSLGTVFVGIRGDDSKLDADLKKANKQIAAFALAAGAAIAFGMKKAVDAAIIQEAAEKRLESVIRATGMAAGFTADQMKKMASSLQAVTTVGDETILAGQAILATFKQIHGEAFERTTKAALDMSEVMQQDLRSSVVMLGKALNDPIKNLSAMSRAGVQFTKVQTDMIKELAAAGDMMGAQEIILDELESQFGGAAEAARDQFGGAMTAAANAGGDLLEQIGFIITKSEGMIGVIKDLESTFNNLITTMKGGMSVWDFFWGESKIEQFKRESAAALELATSYKGEFAGIGGDQTGGDTARTNAIRKTLEDEHAFFLNHFSKIDDDYLKSLEARRDLDLEFQEEKAARLAAETQALSDKAALEFAIEQELTANKKAEEMERQKLQDATMKGALNNATFALREIGKTNATAFAAYKAIKIAETIVATASSAQKSYDAMASIPYVGPALGAAAAAAAIAAGMMQISAINSASPGGGGSVSAGGYGGAAPTYGADPVTGIPDQAEQLPAINVNIENYVDSEENRRNLVDWLNDFVEDKGGRLVASDAQFAGNLT